MKVYLDHSNITQNMHGASKNYRYVLDVSLNLKKDGLEKRRKKIELRSFLQTIPSLLSKLLRIPKLLAPNILLVPLDLLMVRLIPQL